MYARRPSFSRIRTVAWHVGLCLAVFALLCRAAVPVGYMPDLSGHRGQAFAITLCNGGGGAAVIFFPAGQTSDDNSPDESLASPACPFGLATAQLPSPDAPTLALVGDIFVQPLRFAWSDATQRAGPALGPPLGSRAPPPLLG